MLPEMIVEKDNRLDTSHGLRAPSEPGTAEYKKQLSDMLELCQGAKVSTTGGHPWPTRVIEILKEHAPFDLHDVSFALLKFGFMSWRDCVSFVMDDNCDDFASLVLKYSQAEGVQHSRNRGFIDGDGIGYKRRYRATAYCP